MASENYVGAGYTPKEYIEEKVTEDKGAESSVESVR